MTGITASVGLGGRNRRTDVLIVQGLLEAAGVSPGAADGRCGRLTIHAIEQFQGRVLHRPDGRVDVHGPTIRRLTAKPAAHPRPVAAGGQAQAGGRAQAGGGGARAGADRPTPATSPQAPPIPARAPATPPPPHPAAVQQAHSFWRQHSALPGPEVNAGIVCPSGAQMMQILGDPTGHRVASRIATESVGPFRATGLKPALASLRAILSRVHNDLPDLYGLLGSNGMHNVRRIRNSRGYSNHAWGIAIDLLIAGKAPAYGEPFSYRGIDALVPYFHGAGWYWGGGYRTVTRKDAMHFECGLALIRSFQS